MKNKVAIFFVCMIFALTFSVRAQDADKTQSSNPRADTPEPPNLSTLLSQTVVFLYQDKTPPKSDALVAGNILGTAFIVGLPVPGVPGKSIPFIVTAKHVIANQSRVLGRYSMKGGSKPRFIKYDLKALRKSNDFWEHPEDDGVDIVVFRSLSYEDTRKTVFPIDLIASKEVYNSENIRAADRVVIPSLMARFPGTTQNYPIFRDGSIALITEEPIEFSWKFGSKKITTTQRMVFINSTVNEGFSGAPVFLWPGIRSTPQGITTGGKTWLLGVVHGFQPTIRKIIDAEGENVVISKPAYEPQNLVEVRLPERNVNIFSQENSATGMIFPSWQILEILNSKSVTKRVQELSDIIKKAKLKETKN